MDYESFKKQIRDLVCEAAGCGARVTVRQVLKNNGVKLDGLTIMEGEVNVSPTIYLNSFYEDHEKGKGMDEIIKEIMTSYQKCKPEEYIDFSFLKDINQLKGKITYKLVNYERNRELLKVTPHIRFLDLAIIFLCLVGKEPDGNVAIVVKETHMEMWKSSVRELYDLARENTPRLLTYEFKNMGEVLGAAFGAGDDSQPGHAPMYVLTNCSRTNGAAVILYQDVLASCAKKLKDDFYILPSSVHEVLLVPMETGVSVADLKEMVVEVNGICVGAEEFLSDNVYHYKRSENRIILEEL